MDQKSRTAASTASIQPVIWRRETRGGRTLEYELKVIQQPERARACGSGAKSSADRRPVDPPPVVELCIWDINGMGPHGKEDVTFSYEANFFLFATLEVHRAYAMARGQTPHPAQQVPVLTGMPVSGMAYLDRPKEAGYFIFPDLSVRHEGKYRLSFNLYEETKRPEDTDKEVTADGQSVVGGAAPEASFDWRMEVKSTEFTVYSAKKFPGLAESTNLSRTVAEQGCRVRIRRDVRMRRRDGKPTGDYDEAQEEEARGREQEQFNRERSRSNSAGSDMVQRNTGYSSPSAPQPIRPVGGYLGDFGGQSQPQSFAPPPLPVAASQSYPRPQPSYNHPTVGPLNTTGFQQSQQINHHQQFDRQYPQSARAYAPQENFEIERRASYAGHGPVNAPPHAQQAAYYPPPPERQYSQFPPQAYHRPSESSVQTQLPPIRAPEANHESFIPPSDISSLRNLAHAPSSAPMYPRAHGNSYPPQPHYITPQPHVQQEIVQTGSKRGFESAFTPDIKPLRDGQRPNADHENDDIEVEEEATLEYKRADGTAITRAGIPYKG